MRVAVIGAGVTGNSCAYELAADGHAVTVFERHGSVAAEASFAGAGVVAPHLAAPWAAPGRPRQLLQSLWTPQAPWHLSRRALAWVWRSRQGCNAAAYQRNSARLQRLAQYSLARLRQLTHSLQLDFEHGDGYLLLLRSAEDAALAGASGGTVLDAQQCRRIEPGLGADAPLHGGIYFAQDMVANCRQFAILMREQAERLGAEFRFHTTVQSIEPGRTPSVVSHYDAHAESNWLTSQAAPRLDFPATDVMPAPPQTEPFDAVLVCAAMGAAQLLRTHGLKLPMQPLSAYSITLPLRVHEAHPDIGPRCGVFDVRHQVAVTRLGTRVRVSGGAEIGGTLNQHHAATLERLYKVLDDWFAGSVRFTQAQVWKGAQPVLPDGMPRVGASGLPGVWLNLGHGASGWALACGCARALADMLAQRSPGVDLEG